MAEKKSNRRAHVAVDIYRTDSGRYEASLKYGRKKHYLGTFSTIVEAQQAREKKVAELGATLTSDGQMIKQNKPQAYIYARHEPALPAGIARGYYADGNPFYVAQANFAGDYRHTRNVTKIASLETAIEIRKQLEKSDKVVIKAKQDKENFREAYDDKQEPVR